MNSRLQPPSALLIVRDLVRDPEPPPPPAWLVVALVVAFAVLPLLAMLVGGAP